jgi:hypothetical protein
MSTRKTKSAATTAPTATQLFPTEIVSVESLKPHTPLIKKPGIEIPTGPNEYGMELIQMRPQVKSSHIKRMVETFKQEAGQPELSTENR